MEIGDVKFIKPKDPLLSRWIKGYYVQVSRKSDFHSKVTFFQNITTTISIYKNSVSTLDGRYRREDHKIDSGFKSILVGLVDKYQEVEFFGPVDRLAIVFYPGGLNHFVDLPLGGLLEVPSSFFHYYDHDFNSFLPIVYSKSDLEKKRDLLDDFFLKKYNPFEDEKLIEAISRLTTLEPILKVESLAKALDVSRRTLLRKFRKHLGYSIEQYISVIKFRKALLQFQAANGTERLTDIALESDYYDQAEFNRQMKSRSGLTPKELFSQLNIVDDVLFWKT